MLVRSVQLRPEESESVSGPSWTVGSQLRLRDVATISALARVRTSIVSPVQDYL